MPKYKVAFPDGDVIYQSYEDLVTAFGTTSTYTSFSGKGRGFQITHRINSDVIIWAWEVKDLDQEIHEGPTSE